ATDGSRASASTTLTVRQTFILPVSKAGTGSGTVTSSESPPRVNCDPTCSASSVSYDSGTVVTLTASAASGSTFDSWGGCDTSSGTTCTMTMNAATTVTATFTLQRAATPTFSPTPGTYTGSVNVTITDSTAGATIYYTTDGSTPTTGSSVYGGPIPLTQTTTVRAMAAASGMANSVVGSATYTIQQQVATPTFSPAPGAYTSSVSVTISDSTAGATIYYTTDGSTTTTGSSVYGGPIPLTQTTTVRAMAA